MRSHFKALLHSKSTTLAINAGVDILLFANQLEKNSVKEIVETIYKQVENGAIP
ncbi:MAG: hypothetical protein Q9M40_05790 [Sulfurimonas sp.]|nr:hypothetical protein [Sulfurimonas sp.]